MSENISKLICFNFYNGWREITGLYKNSLGIDVTPQKLYVLELLQKDSQITVNDLSKGMNLNPSAVSTLLSRMEKKDLIIRSHGTTDRRSVYVQLTQEGHLEKQRLLEKFDRLSDNLNDSISQDELKTLQDIVNKIRHNHKTSQG